MTHTDLQAITALRRIINLAHRMRAKGLLAGALVVSH
jgi:hypothetical protein